MILLNVAFDVLSENRRLEWEDLEHSNLNPCDRVYLPQCALTPQGNATIREHQTQEQSVSQQDKLLAKILSGTSDSNIPFTQMCQLLRRLGFEERIRGSHHIFTKEGIEEILNLQPKGSQAKAYQVKQVRTVILKYQLGGQDDASL